MQDISLQDIKKKAYEHYGGFSKYATVPPKDAASIRYFGNKANESLRSPFSVDVDKIMNNPFYNHYSDKTQVFSFYHNDQITRRATHVQLVARIAKLLSMSLGLNIDLTEAIALGHDIGHTPFGHVGEKYLNELYHKETGRFFNHNVHSVRALNVVTPTNLTIPTLDGIICHNGEKPQGEYHPSEQKSPEEFSKMVEDCYTKEGFVGTLRPFTLEGCVVRISDIIAYVMKDRQDAKKIGLNVDFEYVATLGMENYEFLGNITENIVLNSYDKPYIKMDDQHFEDLYRLKNENFEKIYGNKNINKSYSVTVQPMMSKLYYQFKEDIKNHNTDSLIYKHHINYGLFKKTYEKKENFKTIDDIVVDYIASMTDDYFIDLYHEIYGDDEIMENVKYVGYFDDERR
ncbi:MAG: HD domain-containing protein [Lachnospiraceae bacterium]|nr:HD domain-containing protein [Lachnospiraceae bacterium]